MEHNDFVSKHVMKIQGYYCLLLLLDGTLIFSINEIQENSKSKNSNSKILKIYLIMKYLIFLNEY